MCSSLNTDFYSLKVIFSTGHCNFFIHLFVSVLSQQITGAEFTCCLLCGNISQRMEGRRLIWVLIFLFSVLKKTPFFSPPPPPSHASLKAESLTEDEMACFEVCFPAAPPPRCLAVIVGALQRHRWGNGIRCGECFKCLLCGGLKKRRWQSLWSKQILVVGTIIRSF